MVKTKKDHITVETVNTGQIIPQRPKQNINDPVKQFPDLHGGTNLQKPAGENTSGSC